MRSSGFEPPRYCYRQPLKLVRLPVPPRPHRGENFIVAARRKPRKPDASMGKTEIAKLKPGASKLLRKAAEASNHLPLRRQSSRSSSTASLAALEWAARHPEPYRQAAARRVAKKREQRLNRADWSAALESEELE